MRISSEKEQERKEILWFMSFGEWYSASVIADACCLSNINAHQALRILFHRGRIRKRENGRSIEWSKN